MISDNDNNNNNKRYKWEDEEMIEPRLVAADSWHMVSLLQGISNTLDCMLDVLMAIRFSSPSEVSTETDQFVRELRDMAAAKAAKATKAAKAAKDNNNSSKEGCF